VSAQRQPQVRIAIRARGTPQRQRAAGPPPAGGRAVASADRAAEVAAVHPSVITIRAGDTQPVATRFPYVNSMTAQQLRYLDARRRRLREQGRERDAN
jgi:hypothetical protein